VNAEQIGLCQNKLFMKKIIFLLAIATISAVSFSQSVAINTTGNSADNSAMLDISSTNKGMLTPRMTTAQRTAIVSPANGLLVFDTNTRTFWFYSTTWKEITLSNGGGGGGFALPYSGVYSDPGKIFSINNPDSSNGAAAVYGKSGNTGIGITPGINIGVWGDNSRGLGLLGTSVNGVGTYGLSFQNHGVSGYTTSTSFAGVYGSNSSNGGPGILGEVSGFGSKGVLGRTTGMYGFAGWFESTDTANVAATLISTNNGRHTAGIFQTTNPNNTNDVLAVNNGSKGTGLSVYSASVGTSNSSIYTYHDGSGDAINAVSKLGVAGKFETNNAANTASTVSILNFGSGSSLNIGNLHTSSTSPMINTASEGLGNGLEVSLMNVNSFGHAIYVNNSGSGAGILATSEKGIPGLFKIENSTSTNTALYATTNGTGSSLKVENFNAGAVSSLATFRKNGNNVTRIDGTGKGFFNGGTQNSGADLAEAFDVTGNRNEYEAGDVLVISTDKDRAVEKSSGPYSTLVAGVYATKPGVLLTEENIETDLADKVPMGVVGVIPTKVCTEGGEIKRGDLLVTSSIPGVAMKADIDKVKPGQVIGKALENYSGGLIGKIKLLVNVK
jgi:hypothetical protein